MCYPFRLNPQSISGRFETGANNPVRNIFLARQTPTRTLMDAEDYYSQRSHAPFTAQNLTLFPHPEYSHQHAQNSLTI